MLRHGRTAPLAPARGAASGSRRNTIMRGRWPAGLEYIDKLEGSGETKERVKSILCTLFREARVLEVCAQHDIGDTRFEQLRAMSIQGPWHSVAPRPAGRASRAC